MFEAFADQSVSDLSSHGSADTSAPAHENRSFAVRGDGRRSGTLNYEPFGAHTPVGTGSDGQSFASTQEGSTVFFGQNPATMTPGGPMGGSSFPELTPPELQDMARPRRGDRFDDNDGTDGTASGAGATHPSDTASLFNAVSLDTMAGLYDDRSDGRRASADGGGVPTVGPPRLLGQSRSSGSSSQAASTVFDSTRVNSASNDNIAARDAHASKGKETARFSVPQLMARERPPRTPTGAGPASGAASVAPSAISRGISSGSRVNAAEYDRNRRITWGDAASRMTAMSTFFGAGDQQRFGFTTDMNRLGARHASSEAVAGREDITGGSHNGSGPSVGGSNVQRVRRRSLVSASSPRHQRTSSGDGPLVPVGSVSELRESLSVMSGGWEKVSAADVTTEQSKNSNSLRSSARPTQIDTVARRVINNQAINPTNLDQIALAVASERAKEAKQEQLRQQSIRKRLTQRIAGAFEVADEEEDVMEQRGYNQAQQYSDGYHMIPWDQRATIPIDTSSDDMCGCCVAPRFWERVDWALRCTMLCVIPTAILTLHPDTPREFLLPGMPVVMSLWLSQPTFGAGLRELLLALKGTLVAFLLMMITVSIYPENVILWLFLFCLTTFGIALLADDIKKPAAFLLTASMNLLRVGIIKKETVDHVYFVNFFINILVGLAMGCAGLLLPRINWSLSRAKNHCVILANTASVAIIGICSSFWTGAVLDRELNLVRIRQLKHTSARAIAVIDSALEESAYEPHGGLAIATVRARRDLLETVMNIINSTSLLIEVIADNPAIIDERTCNQFGTHVADELGAFAAAMDTYLLKICDFDMPLSRSDFLTFEAAKSTFDRRVEEARHKVMLDSDEYMPGAGDIVLGFFLFSVDEIGEVLLAFREPTSAPSLLQAWLHAPLDDTKEAAHRIVQMFKALLSGRIPRRTKEAIKLSLAIGLSSLVETLTNTSDPLSGSVLIPWVYERFGAGTYNLMMMRVLGTVFGSIVAFMGTEFVNANLAGLLAITGVLTLAGAFVQTSRNYSAAGNAFIWGVVSISSKFDARDVAINRFTANVIAVLIYFLISFVVWPQRTTIKIRTSLDEGLRATREATSVLLRNLTNTGDCGEILQSAGVELRELQRSIVRQEALVPAAVKEPTLVSSVFPEEQWIKLVRSQKNIAHLLALLRFAFSTFASSQAGQGPLDGDGSASEMASVGDGAGRAAESLHWRLLEAIQRPAADIGEMIFASLDLHLLMLSKVAQVPTQFLVRLRVGLINRQAELEATFIQALTDMLKGDDQELARQDAALAEIRDREPSAVAPAEIADRSHRAPSLLPSLTEPPHEPFAATMAAGAPPIEVPHSPLITVTPAGLNQSRQPSAQPQGMGAMDDDPLHASSRFSKPALNPQMASISSYPDGTSSVTDDNRSFLRNTVSGLDLPGASTAGAATMPATPARQAAAERAAKSKRAEREKRWRAAALLKGAAIDSDEERTKNDVVQAREARRAQAAQAAGRVGGAVVPGPASLDPNAGESSVADGPSPFGGGVENGSMFLNGTLLNRAGGNTPIVPPSSRHSTAPSAGDADADAAEAAVAALAADDEGNIMEATATQMMNRRRAQQNKSLLKLAENMSFHADAATMLEALRKQLRHVEGGAPQHPEAPDRPSDDAPAGGAPPAQGAPSASAPAVPPVAIPKTLDAMDEQDLKGAIRELVLTNGDIHSVEAFVFGLRALVSELGELEKNLLEMQHVEEINDLL